MRSGCPLFWPIFPGLPAGEPEYPSPEIPPHRNSIATALLLRQLSVRPADDAGPLFRDPRHISAVVAGRIHVLEVHEAEQHRVPVLSGCTARLPFVVIGR